MDQRCWNCRYGLEDESNEHCQKCLEDLHQYLEWKPILEKQKGNKEI